MENGLGRGKNENGGGGRQHEWKKRTRQKTYVSLHASCRQGAGFVGKGNYGQVYIAEDTLTGGVVAVKRQKYPSTEAARELAFAKTLASNPSVPAGLKFPACFILGNRIS